MAKRAAFSVGATCVCVALVVAAIRLAGSGDGHAASTPRPVALDQLAPGITSLGPVDLPIYSAGHIFVSGSDEVSVFGSYPIDDDGSFAGSAGATFDLGEGTWRRWPAWPHEEPLSQPALVWTGTEAIVVGSACHASADEESLNCEPGTVRGAALNLDTFRWRSIGLPDGAPELTIEERARGFCCQPMGWTGSSAAFLFSGEPFSYDPVGDAWRALPALPEVLETSPPEFCETERGLVAIYMGRSIAPFQLAEDIWSALPELRPPLPDDPFFGARAVCGDASLLAIASGWNSAWLLHLHDGTWQPQPAPTNVRLQRTRETTVSTVAETILPPEFPEWHWTGSSFVFWNPTSGAVVHPPGEPSKDDLVTHRGVGVTYDPEAQTWDNVAEGPQWGPVAWLDGIGFAARSVQDSGLELIAYRPAPEEGP